ncbi:DHH family phosphoesterase [Salinirubrum litoreum]|uniref:DHH family phosphoesterase n=1 Tax=Salinirubrum litoreum TaxID=1126234 RepID=A0ABD5RBH7_9EURY|nr:DHH family phosphoesterase [Salinirubrum litoreum]
MVTRLVLGCGTVGHAIIDRLVERGARDLHVVDAHERRVTALRDENVDAVTAEPTDPSAYPKTVDVVLVGDDDPATNRAAAGIARDRFPEAMVVAYTGIDPTDADRDALASVADRVLDHERLLADRVSALATGDDADRVTRLLRVLRGIEGRLAVVTHDNPDPDAIASALALVRIAQSVGVAGDACYFGDISHQENRALVNLLDLDLVQLERGDDPLAAYGGVALVDHSRPGVNDGLPEETRVDVVIDHHPPRGPVDARFPDLRHEVGATSTLLVDYLDRLGIDPDRTTATALLYGIRVDTKDFTREVSGRDFEAAAFLLPFVDPDVLDRVETPSMSAEVLATTAKAIRNREVRGSVGASGVGRIHDRDALAQAADRLLAMEGLDVVLVHGILDDTVYASGRARGSAIDLGEVLRDAFDQIGSAGGHADMAGAQIPLGIWADVDEGLNETLETAVAANINGRFFETVSSFAAVPADDNETDPLLSESSSE